MFRRCRATSTDRETNPEEGPPFGKETGFQQLHAGDIKKIVTENSDGGVGSNLTGAWGQIFILESRFAESPEKGTDLFLTFPVANDEIFSCMDECE